MRKLKQRKEMGPLAIQKKFDYARRRGLKTIPLWADWEADSRSSRTSQQQAKQIISDEIGRMVRNLADRSGPLAPIIKDNNGKPASDWDLIWVVEVVIRKLGLRELSRRTRD